MTIERTPVAPAPEAPPAGGPTYTTPGQWKRNEDGGLTVDLFGGRPTVEDPFQGGFINAKGETIDIAGGGPFAELLKVVGRETAPIALDASAQALARQEQVLKAIGHKGELPKYAVNINLDRIQDPEQINGTIMAVAEQLGGKSPDGLVEQARRGTRSHEETVAAAEELFRRDEGFLFQRPTGRAANAEEITAARMVMASARDRTTQLAQAVVAGKASPEDMIAFRRSLAQMAAIQLQLHGMAAEAGRALNAFRIEATPGLLDMAQGRTAAPEASAAAPTATATPPEASAAPGSAQEAPTGALPTEPTPSAGELTAQGARGQDIDQLIQGLGGAGSIQQMAQAFLALPTPAAQNSMARASVQPGFLDMLGELWFNFVLSGPATHVVNMTGNAVTLGMTTAEREVAAWWGKLFGFAGMKQGVQSGEAAAMSYAYWAALGDAWRLANFALRHGESAGPATGYTMPLSTADIWRMSGTQAQQITAGAATAASPASKVASGRPPAVTGANVMNAVPTAVNAASQHIVGRNVMSPIVLGKRGALGRMTDMLSLMIDGAGGVLRTPTRFLGAEDQLWKTIAYRGEIRARAYREGVQSGLSGNQLEQYIDQAINQMTALPADIAAGEAFARHVTMNEALMSQFGQGLQKAGASKLGYLFAPFVRVTTNILDFSTQRIAFPLRPAWWKDLTGQDPVKRDLAMAKASTGAMVWMTAMATASTMYDADEDAPVVVTGAGPTDPAKKRLWLKRGYKEYSVRIGGKDGTWYSYSRLDPAGQVIGIAADVVNIIDQLGEVESDELAAALVMGIGNNLVNKNYMSSIAESMEVFTSYDPAQWQKWVRSRAASYQVPNIVAQYVADQDPYLRRVTSIGEELAKRRSADGRRQLPLTRDLEGKPIQQEWLFGSRFSGFAVSDHKPDPVADELWRLEMHFTSPPKTLRGVELDGWQWSRYQQLAGYALKMPAGTVYTGPMVIEGRKASRLRLDLGGMGMWEALGKLIKTPEYKMATDGADPPGQRVQMITQIRDLYRKAAQDRVLAEYPELIDGVVEAERVKSLAKGVRPEVEAGTQAHKRATLERAIHMAEEYEVAE